MSSGGGSSQPATTTQVSEPWAEQKPFLTKGFTRAEDLYKQGLPGFYQGKTVAGFDPYQEQAFGMAADRAMQPNMATASSQDMLNRTIGGEFLGGNQYFDDSVTRAMDRARSGVDAQFAGSGRYGSGLHQNALGETFGGIAGDMYMNQYNTERDNMLKAAELAPTVDQAGQQMDYTNLANLEAIGGQRQGMEQELLNLERAKYDYNSALPQQNLANYLAAIQGNYGGTSSGTSYAPGSGGGGFSGGGAMGGALGGAQLGSMIMPGIGTGIGAVAGGLLGGFM